MRKLLDASLAGALVSILLAMPSQAGYLNVSGNWKAPASAPMSKGTALSVAGSCKNISTYSNLSGNSGATIVAGPHTSPTDSLLHLTVRLYKNGSHEKSCHVYIGKNNSFSSCNCVYTD
jgi:hypothetical protein